MGTMVKIPYLLLLVSATAWASEATLQQCRGIADSSARLACYDALPLPTTSAAGADSRAAPARTPVPETPGQFGLTREAVAPVVELSTIESTIPGHFDGWYPNRRVRLANGQVWQVADGTTRLYELDSPKVTIRRGVLGAFYLDLTVDNHSIRVRRVE
jgi:hypothetical protein